MDVPVDDPGATAPADPPAPPPGAPDGGMIGRYRLLRQLGEGGWGAVYLAEQSEPVRRRVALKVIKLGMDTRSVLARFEAERQALAMMDHPNIARVLDSGATVSGRPYFVMELVRGLRITEYCDRHRLGIDARLRLFLQVCAAVQHAHEKGIIHRDLKPSNILVAGEGAEAAAKVIDFGIAKSVHGRIADATVHTSFEQAIGTPAYMSPEQADSGGLDLDTRSDVYALGVVLYELLAGRPPFDPAALERAGPDGMRRILREDDPPVPSRATAPAAGDDGGRASARGVAPSRLAALLRGELDWIVMKALEKRRERRYASAAALAEDVARHLADEPVLARPAGRAYLIRKFIARHRAAVAAAAAVGTALVAGTVVSLWQARVAREAENQARAAYRRSDDLLDFLTGSLLRELEDLSRLDILVTVGDQAMRHLTARHPDLADESTRIGAATVRRLTGVAQLRQGKLNEAARTFEEGLRGLEELLELQPTNVAALFERGQAEFYLGEIFRRRREASRALEWLGRYRQTALRLVALEPGEYRWRKEALSALHNLAVLKRDTGDLEGARRDMQVKRDALRKLVIPAAEGAAERDDVARKIQDATSWLGSIEEQSGRLAAALVLFEEEARGLDGLLGSSPDKRNWQYRQAENLTFQGTLLSVTGRPREAREAFAKALALMRTLAATGQQQLRWRRLLLRLELREAEDARGAGAEAAADTVLRAARQLAETAPEDALVARTLVGALRLKAGLVAAADAPRARTLLEEALTRGEPRTGGPLADAEAAAAAFAQTCLALAVLEPARREALLRRAGTALEPFGQSSNWRILDARVRLDSALGEVKAAADAIRRLRTFGYQPITPWPSGASDVP
ncbi:MAG: Serine/threonine-protein kinase PknB [Verrucomicrobiota bacterium]|jgi:serine/threonine-protein kinase